MKKLTTLLAAALCLGTLTACGGGNQATTQTPEQNNAGAVTTTEDKVIRVGATPTPHAEILEAAKPVLAEQGWALEIVELTDYIIPNTSLSDGELDANFFQHTPYLNTFNAENGTNLVVASEVHYEPFGVYPGKTATLGELQDGGTIAVPNDGSNETRALLLLQDQGLITLKEGIDPTVSATKLDIVDNPKNLQITEIAAEQLPRSLEDVDFAVINGNYALQAGLNANENAVAVENENYGTVYVNVVACRAGEENSEKITALTGAIKSDAVKTFIADTYQGAVVPVF